MYIGPTSTTARMLIGLKVTMQSMQKAGFGEVTARATDKKDGFSDQFPEKRKTLVRRLSAQAKV